MHNITLKKYPEVICIPHESLIKLAQDVARQNPDVIESPDLAGVVYDEKYGSWGFTFKINTDNGPGIQAFFEKYDEIGEYDPNDEISSSGFMEVPECMSQAILTSMKLVDYPVEEFKLGSDGELFLLPKGIEYTR